MKKSSWCPRLCWVPLFLPLLLLLLAGGAVPPPAAAQISGYTLSASPSTVSPGASLSVSWTAPSGRPSTDWVGLYRVGDPDGSFLWWSYTNGTASGSRSVAAPSQTGQYEFRYFLQDGYTLAARSNPVTVEGGGSTDPRASTGEWAAPFGWPGVAVHSALLPTGRVMFWSKQNGLVWSWDPQSGALASLRGLEVAVDGDLVEEKGALLLRIGGTGEVVELAPLVRKVEWDAKAKQAQAPTAEERGAFERLRAQARGRGPVRVTGPLAAGVPGGRWRLEVRQFRWL